jgi:hypothetical protein
VMENVNLNVDAQTLEQCLKSVSHFGRTEYINICTEKISVVPWGNADWFGIVTLCVIGIGIVVLIGTILVKVLFD